MKKNYAFALVAIVLFGATSFAFAQNSEAVEKMTGFRGVALRTYCSFASLFGARNDRCFAPTQNGTGNTASVGAAGVGNTPSTPQAPAPTGNQSGQSASIGGFTVPTVAPQIIERTVIVQGTPGPQGPAGAPGMPGPGATGAFVNVPQVFWSGGGGNAAPTVVSSVSPLPGGALPGQVLTTNASGTVEWQYITIPSATNSPSILGSLANIFAQNGLNLATTSTSTTLKLGGLLTEDTTIDQTDFNFSLTRGNIGIISQGTTTVPTPTGSWTNNEFTGFKASEGTHDVFAGIFRRNAPDFPLFEVQAFDSATNRQGFSAIGRGVAQMGSTNSTTTNQIRADIDKIRLSSNTTSASSSQIRVDGAGVHFSFDDEATNGLTKNGKTYSFPRMDGPFDGVMATDALGQLRFRTLLEILSTTSTSTLAQMPLWSTTGNTGTNPADNFIGTTDASGFAVRTNNVERLRVTEDGNVGIGTTTPMRPLTVVGNVGGTLGLFQNTNAGAPAGISLQATRADTSLSTRIGWFVNPNAGGDDRLATHAVGTGDLWSFSKNGDLVGSLGTSFDQRNDTIPARLSVMANDARPVAYFENGAQTYARFANSPSAFSQSYDVGVESVGGTFNIIDTNAAQTRLSINRNGNVQVYNMLNVGSYGFGLGDAGDSGFGNSSQAYMRYMQGQSVGNARLELYDSQNNLSTVISQSSNGTPTEFNRTNKDIDFRIAGTVDNNLFLADASEDQVRIGTSTGPALAKLTVFTDEDMGEALFARQLGGGDRTLAFGRDGLRTNTTGTFGNSAWSGQSTLEVFGGTPGRAVFRVQGHWGQTAPLQEWRDAAGTVLSVVDANGSLGLGTDAPSQQLEITKSFELPDTTDSTTGVIYKGTNPFIHNYADAGTDGQNIFIGIGSGNFTMADTGLTREASENVGVGQNTLSSLTAGYQNTAVGSKALQSNTEGYGNTAYGAYTLSTNTNGWQNTAIGKDALFSNSVGNINTAIGSRSLVRNTSGHANVAVGVNSLEYTSTGFQNAALGVNVLQDLTTGSNNAAFGYNTGRGITTGSFNTILGSNVTGLAPTLSNNIIIADGAGNRRINVDSAGNVGIGTNTPGFKIDSVITTGGNNGFRQTSTDPSALGLVRLQNNAGAISQLSVYGSNHFLPELRNNGGVGASNDFYIYSDSETPTGGTHSINFMTGGWTPSTQTRMTINSTGNVGIGTILPSTRLEVNSGIANDSGFVFSQLNSASPALGTELQFLTVDALGKVILSDLDASVFATTSPSGVDGSVQFNQGGLFASNTNFNWDNTNARLGIGTNVPGARLSVLDTSEQLRLSYDTTNYAAFLVDSMGGLQITPGIQQGLTTLNRFRLSNDPSTNHTVLDVTNSFGTGVSSVNVGGASAMILRHDNGTNVSSIISNAASRFTIGTPCCTTAPLSLVTRGEDRLFITSDGKVGVGTTSPRAKFDVDGDAWIGQVKISNSLAGFPSPTNAIEFFHGGNQGGGNYGTGIVAGGQTNGTKLLLSSANMDASGQFDHHQLGRIFIPGYGQGISFRAAGGMASTSNAFQWTVGDTNPAVSTQYERMVLTQDGSLGIGTNAPSRQLHVVSNGTGFVNGRVARFDNASATCFINPSFILGIQCSSDRNLKKDIVAVDTSLEALTRLKPSMFHWNNEDSSSPLQYGFIAQEVEEVFPTFVSTDSETGLKSVAFGNLIPVTVKAIQELNAHLGDLSKDTSTQEFAASTIFKRFTDAFKTLTVAFKNITADKATVKELCLPKSDGTVICLTGDQVAAIAANAGVTIDPVVIEEEPVEEITPIDPIEDIEPTPVEDTPEDNNSGADDTPQDGSIVDLSESPGNPAPEADLGIEGATQTQNQPDQTTQATETPLE